MSKKKKEYRSCGLISISSKVISNTETKLEKAGIPKDSYRINYFSNSAELIVEASLLETVKSTLG